MGFLQPNGMKRRHISGIIKAALGYRGRERGRLYGRKRIQGCITPQKKRKKGKKSTVNRRVSNPIESQFYGRGEKGSRAAGAAEGGAGVRKSLCQEERGKWRRSNCGEMVDRGGERRKAQMKFPGRGSNTLPANRGLSSVPGGCHSKKHCLPRSRNPYSGMGDQGGWLL